MNQEPDSQQELVRVRRLYETLGQLTHRVHSISDADQLFTEACRFIVEVAEFQSAWIGTIDKQWTELQPRALAGAITAHREAALRPRLLANYQGILTPDIQRGDYQVIDDLATDPRTSALSARSSFPNVRCSGVFPIRSTDQVSGVLVVHADKSGAMPAHIAVLLLQVAETVGAALGRLDGRLQARKIEASEVERRQLEDQLSSIAATVPGVICTWRLAPDGRNSVPFASAAMREVYGLDPAEVREDAAPILQKVHPDDQPLVAKLIQESAQRMTPWQQDFRFQHPTKGWIWVEGHAMPQREPEGSTRWHGFIHDVTDRKRSEEVLRQSEERFRELFRKSPVAYQSLDEKGCFVDANDRLCELLGYEQEDLIGRPFEILWPIDDRERFAHCFAALLESGQASNDVTLLRKNGSRILVHLEGYVQRNEKGQFSRTHCVLHDITEQRKAEEGLRLQSAALAAAANAIVITDPNGVVIWSNPAFWQMTGYSAEETNGRVLGDLVRSGQHSRGFYRQMWDAILAGRPWHGELTNRRKDGSAYPEQMSITPILDANQKVSHFIAIKQDISEQKRLEALLLRTQRLESVGRLASGIAHDLNNVLTPMLMAPLMLRSLLDDPTALQIIDSIESSARRGAAMIKQLLTFSRGLPGERIPMRLIPIAREMAKLIEQTFPKNITLATQFDRDTWPIVGDPTQIHQVLMNLCVNARDAMPRGGTLTISVERTTMDDQAARLHGVKPGSYSVLEVKDSGIGISAEDLDRIYDPFFTTKPLGEGTGLGLSTALGIVKSHNGLILVDSVMHQGTTFRVLLPAHESTTSPTASGPSQEQLPVGSGEQVLVVDDEELTRQMIQQVLEQYGYHVLLASSGIEALAHTRSHPNLRLILTDVMMPGMDGVTLVHKLQNVESRAKVVIMTGLHAQPDVIDVARRYGVQQLDKPFTAQSLLHAVQTALRDPVERS